MGSLFTITTNPVTLYAIDQNHQKIRSMDMYEFYPLQKGNFQQLYYFKLGILFLKYLFIFLIYSFTKIKDGYSTNARIMVFDIT